MSDKAISIIDEAATAAADQVRHEFNYVRPLCGSPIEEVLLATIIASRTSFATLLVPLYFYGRGGFEPTSNHTFPGTSVDVHLQAQVGNYRADFLFDYQDISTRRVIIVECDGHDYHERTKEQARHDKQRDRYMAMCGYTVLRFTGSEIHNNPEGCVEEIVDHLRRVAETNGQ